MKRYFAFVLVLIFVFSSVMPVLAVAKMPITQEESIGIIKKLFDTTDYDKFNINYNENDGNRKVWDLNWSKTQSPYGSLSASIDADSGNILNIYMYKGYDPDRKVTPIPKYNEEEAKEIAKAFAEKLQPEEYAKTKLIKREEPFHPLSSSYSDSYNFNFARIENDVPVEGNSINIRMDAHTGNIESYSFTWSWEPLPSSEGLISMADAEGVFSDEVGLKLIYQRYFNYSTQEEDIRLVYTLDGPRGILIDAITGELIDSEYFMRGSGAEESLKQMNDSGLTPVESKEVEVTKNCISREAATGIAKKYFDIPDGYKQRSANLHEDYDNPGQKIWNINWEKTDENGEGGSINAQVNAINSELLGFNIYDYSKYTKEFKQNYDRASAQKKAEKFLKKFQQSRFENTRLEEVKEPANDQGKMRQHDFTYTRLVNDIPYIANGFNITVDAETGAITFYRMRWHDRDFPSPEGVVEKVKAEAYFLEDVGLELVYTPLYNPKSRKSEYKLVYKIKPANSYVFDAFDFKPLDYSGKPIEKETETTFSDIKGHWAQGDIQLLVDLGIIKSEEDKFKPDENTTEGNFIKLLMISKNHRISDNIPIPIIKLESDGAKTDEEIQKYIDAAIKLGWAKPGEVNAQNPLSREKAAVFVVRAMGFDKVASLSDIYKDIAEDASIVKPEYKGHVTIALGLKLLSTDSGGFKPKAPVSNAQAATILVRMLKLDS